MLLIVAGNGLTAIFKGLINIYFSHFLASAPHSVRITNVVNNGHVHKPSKATKPVFRVVLTYCLGSGLHTIKDLRSQTS